MLRSGDAVQALCGLLGLCNTSLLEVDVDQQREQRTLHAGRADGGHLRRRSPRWLVRTGPWRARHRRVRDGMRRAMRTASGCCSKPFEQLPSLLQSALPDPQIGQPDDRGSTSLRHASVKVSSGVDELHLGLLPAPGRGQDAPIVRAAECADHVPAGHHLRLQHASTGPRATTSLTSSHAQKRPTEQVVH